MRNSSGNLLKIGWDYGNWYGDITKKDGMIVEPAFGVLQSGDYIEAFNGTPLKDKEALVTELNKNGTSEAVLAVRRGDQEIEVKMTPVEERINPKLGVWVRRYSGYWNHDLY